MNSKDRRTNLDSDAPTNFTTVSADAIRDLLRKAPPKAKVAADSDHPTAATELQADDLAALKRAGDPRMASDAPTTAGDPRSQPAEGQATEYALAPYLHWCLARVGPAIQNAFLGYTGWAGASRKLDVEAPLVAGLAEPPEFDECLACMEVAQRLRGVPPEVTHRASEWTRALQELMPTFLSAFNYYESHQHNDDRFALGVSLHEALLTSLRAFETADNPLRDAVWSEFRVFAKNLEDEAPSGNRAKWRSATQFLLCGEDLVRHAEQALEALDHRLLGEKIEESERVLADLKKESPNRASAVHEEQDGLDAPPPSDLVEAGVDLLKAARTRVKMAANGARFSDFQEQWIRTGLGALVEGSFPMIEHNFHETLRVYSAPFLPEARD